MKYGFWLMLLTPIAMFLIGWFWTGKFFASLLFGGLYALLFLGLWFIHYIDLDLLMAGRARWDRVQHYRKAIHLLDKFQDDPRFSDHLCNRELASFDRSAGDLRWILWAELHGLSPREEELKADLELRDRNLDKYNHPQR